jgi:hypothetical protein
MLIDSDAHGGGNASGAPTDAEGLFKRLKRDIKTNSRSGPFQNYAAKCIPASSPRVERHRNDLTPQ